MIETEPNRTSTATCITAYYLILSLYLAASFFPNLRVWGISQWAHFGTWVPIMLFVIGAVFPVALFLPFKPRRSQEMLTAESDRLARTSKHTAVFLGIIILAAAGFYLFRARTYFLGDGYTLLSLLSSESPLMMKYHEFGEILAHIWLKQLLGGDSHSAALASYQIISIGSGVILLTAISVFAMKRFSRVKDGLVFVFGMTTCGFMLLYFGYVEQYSLFVLSVTVYVLVGVHTLEAKRYRWVLVPLQLITIFFHIFGVTLIPATIWALVADTPLGKRIGRLQLRWKIVAAASTVAIALGIVSYFYFTSYFFRFALVPIVPDRFTADGYHMFSWRHIADIINLALILVPAAPLAIAGLISMRKQDLIRNPAMQFLLVAIISTFGGAFIFHARLGMPRDWDLFSFPGIPLAIFTYLVLTDGIRGFSRKSALLAVAIGALSLGPRVAALNVSDVAVATLMDYVELDKKVNRTVSVLLRDYLTDSGDDFTKRIAANKWQVNYPEIAILKRAGKRRRSGEYAEAIRLYEKALRMNPIYTDAYNGLGACHIQLGNHDSALVLLQIGIGLNPNGSGIWYNLGSAHYVFRMAVVFFGIVSGAETMPKKTTAMRKTPG